MRGHITINVWFAREANMAVIIAKYPKNRYLMSTWNIETDEIIEGQWVTKKKIKLHQCGMSPDGKYFTFFMVDLRDGYGATMTIVSKPPYFTGIYCQEEEGMWTGGAHFADNNTLIMKPMMVFLNKLPSTIKIVDPNPQSKSGHAGRDERSISFEKKMCVDTRGRRITTLDDRLFIDGVEFIDFNGKEFKQVRAPY